MWIRIVEEKAASIKESLLKNEAGFQSNLWNRQRGGMFLDLWRLMMSGMGGR